MGVGIFCSRIQSRKGLESGIHWDMANSVPSFWNLFSEGMHLIDVPSAKLSLSPLSPVFGRVQADEGLPEVTRGSGGPSGYMVALQLRAIPFIEQLLGRKRVTYGFYPIGGLVYSTYKRGPRLHSEIPSTHWCCTSLSQLSMKSPMRTVCHEQSRWLRRLVILIL